MTVMVLVHRTDVFKFSNPGGGNQYCGGHNLPPLSGIGLTVIRNPTQPTSYVTASLITPFQIFRHFAGSKVLGDYLTTYLK